MNERVIHSAKWLLLMSIFGRASWLLTMLLLARPLGARTYGEFTFYLTYWLIVNRIFGFGLDVWINRFIARNRGLRVEDHIGFTLKLRLVLISGGIALGTAIGSIHREAYFTYFALFVIVGFRQFAENMREFLVGILQGYEEFKQQAVAVVPWDMLQLVIVSASVLIMKIRNSYGLVLILLLVSLGKVALLSREYRLLRVAHTSTLGNADAGLRQILTESLFLGASMLIAFLLGRSHVIFLRIFSGPEVLGKFAVAFIFVEGSGVLLGTVRQAIFPTLSRLWLTQSNAYAKLFCRSLAFYVGVSICLIAILDLVRGTILPIFLKGSFHLSVEILGLLCWVIPVLAVSGGLSNSMIAAGLEKNVVRLQILGLIVNTGLNYSLIKVLGWRGAWLSLLITYGFMSVQYGLVWHRNFVARSNR